MSSSLSGGYGSYSSGRSYGSGGGGGGSYGESSLRRYGSQLSFGSGGGSGYGSYKSGGRSSFSGPSYGGVYDSFSRRPASADRSLSFASMNRGNVSSLKDRFNPQPSYGAGSRYGSSLDRYESKSGYASDIGGGSSKSYGSYGRSVSSTRSSYGGRDSSPPRSSSTRPSRVDYSHSSSRDLGSSSTKDYGKSYSRSTSRDYGSTSRDYGSSSRDYGSSRDLGTSYGSYKGSSDLAQTRKAKDYNLTPFSSRRTKTSDASLTPFSTRRQAVSESSPKPSYERQTSSSTGTVKDTESKSKDSRRKKVIDEDESSDSAYEPEGGSTDPTVKYAISRGTGPMEPDYEMYDMIKASQRGRIKDKKRGIARTKAKRFPVKVYRRKWERPRMINREIQVDIRDLNRFCGRKTQEPERSSRSGRSSQTSRGERQTSESDKPRRHSRSFVNKKEEKKDSIVSQRKARWEEMPAKKEIPKSSSLPKQSGFKPTDRARKDMPAQETVSPEEDQTTEQETSAFEEEEPYVPPQTMYMKRQLQEKKKEAKPKVMPLTTENMSLKDSIEKVKNWKKQLSLVPPDTEEIVRDAQKRKQAEAARLARRGDSVYSEEESTESDVADLSGEPVIYAKGEYNKTKDKKQQNKSAGPVRNKEPQRARSRSDKRTPPNSRRSSKDPVFSPSGSEISDSGFLKEESPNREPQNKRQKPKMFAGVRQFPVENQVSESEKKKGKNKDRKNDYLAKPTTDRSPSPYDNIDRHQRNFSRQKHTQEEDYDNESERSPSPYDNATDKKGPPAIIIDRADSMGLLSGNFPAQSVDSLADFADDSSYASENDSMSRAQSMLSLDTNQSNSLPRHKHRIPKALSLDCLSMGTSNSSLPDLVPASEGNRRQGYYAQVRDIDSLLGFTETEDDFSDDFSDEDTDISMGSDRSFNRRSHHRQSGTGDKDSVILSPVKEENNYDDDLYYRPHTPVHEIVYIGDCNDIDEVLGDDDVDNRARVLEGSHSLRVHGHPDLTLDFPEPPESLMDAPVPDTPDIPLIPHSGSGSGSAGSFPFPPVPEKSHSEEHLNNVKQSASKNGKKSSRAGKTQSMANLDDLDQLLDTIKTTDNKRKKKDPKGNDPFDLFSREARTNLQKDVSPKEPTPPAKASNKPMMINVDLVDSARVPASALSPESVPTAKLIDLSSESNSSTPRRGSPSVKRYPPNYSSEAVKKALAVQDRRGKLTVQELIDICTRKKVVKPPWIEEEEERNFSGYHTVRELLEGMGIDCKKLEDCALQLYKHNGGLGDYSSYLDLESSLEEQWDEMEGFSESKKNSIILRTQLSVRVHACIEKLLNSSGRELRRALFSLKQIFQDDKDLVHEFVNNDGLDCLIKVGSEADQNHQNYILRAMGQVMLYVDGMNGVINHNETIQWLYSLTASKFRLVVKTALKLLLVFVEYTECNTLLLIQAVETVDGQKGTKCWSNIMNLLDEKDGGDSELLVYAMTLINKALNAIPDQDQFYDLTDHLEEQGMEKIIQRHMNRKGADLDLLEQFQIYEAVLKQEDGAKDAPLLQQIENLRNTPRVKSEEEGRKSRRHSMGKPGSTPPSTMRHKSKLPPMKEEENKQEAEPPWGRPGAPPEPVTPLSPGPNDGPPKQGPYDQGSTGSAHQRQRRRHIARNEKDENYVNEGDVPPPSVSNNRRWMMYKISKQKEKEGQVPPGAVPEEVSGKPPQHPRVENQGQVQAAAEHLKSSQQEAQKPGAKPSGDLSGLLNKAKEGLSGSTKKPKKKKVPTATLR